MSEINLESFNSFEPQANFLNLSLLICHLFMGGNFKLVDILYHPDAFEDHLLVSIDTVCPSQIPKTTQNIFINNEIISIDRRGQRTDSILQLIFLPSEQLLEHFNQIENQLTFYHIFVFTISIELDSEEIESIASANVPSSSSLLLVYNTSNDTLKEFVLSKSSIQSIELNNVQLSPNEIFESVFGDSVSGRYLAISLLNETILEKDSYQMRGEMAFASLYFTQMNASFVDAIIWDSNDSSLQHQQVRPIYRPYYSDYNFKYELVPDAEKIPIESAIILHPTPYTKIIDPESWNESVQAIKPYFFIPLNVFFVYGVDIPRQRYNFITSRFWETPSFWILLIAFYVGATILYFLRRHAGLDRESYLYCLFELYCSMIGNGNLRIRNGLEKLFFSAALVAAFFFVAIYLTFFSMHSLLQNDIKVDSFEELAKYDVPFYINADFADDLDYITDLLSKKLKKKPNIAFEKTTGEAIGIDITNAVAIIVEKYGPNIGTILNQEKDYDLITESLGAFLQTFSLISDRYIPDRTIERLEKVTLSLDENGVYRFWWNIRSYWNSIAIQEDTTDRYRAQFDVKPITLGECYQPLVIYMCILITITIIFVIEIFWSRIRSIRVVSLNISNRLQYLWATQRNSRRMQRN